MVRIKHVHMKLRRLWNNNNNDDEHYEIMIYDYIANKIEDEII